MPYRQAFVLRRWLRLIWRGEVMKWMFFSFLSPAHLLHFILQFIILFRSNASVSYIVTTDIRAMAEPSLLKHKKDLKITETKVCEMQGAASIKS